MGEMEFESRSKIECETLIIISRVRCELAITRVIYMLGEPQDTNESWYKYNTSGNNRYRHDRDTMRVEVQVTGRADVEGARDMGESTIPGLACKRAPPSFLTSLTEGTQN